MNSSKRKGILPSSSPKPAQLHFSEDGIPVQIDISLPTGWEDLTQEELRTVLFCLAKHPREEARTHAFIHLAGFQVVGRWKDLWLLRMRSGKRLCLASWQILYAVQNHLDWMNDPPETPVRLKQLGKKPYPAAVDDQLQGLPFGHYLQLDILYQSYLQSRDQAPLRAMATLLYPGAMPDQPSEPELLGVFLWMTSVKRLFSQLFPHLYRPASTSGSAEGLRQENSITREALRQQTDAQIRALTGGDVTREAAVLGIDTWRALTELDAKAREAEDMRRQIQQSRKK